MRLVDAYTIRPDQLQPGDQMLFVIKAMVVGMTPAGHPLYRLYRCQWEGDESSIPQGSRIIDDEAVAESIFPTLAGVGIPD